MNVYAILSFVSFLLFFQALIIAHFILKPSKIKWAFFFFSLSFSFFSFFNFLQHVTLDLDLIYKFDRAASLGWLGFPVFTALLIYRLSNKEDKFISQIIWFLLVPMAVAPFIRFQIHPYSLKQFFFVDGVRYYYLNSGSFWFYLFVAYLLLAAFIAIFILYKWRKDVSQRRQKLQINFILGGMLGFVFLSFLTNIILPYFGLTEIGPLAHVNAIPMGLGLFFAVVSLRQQVFSVDIVSRLITNHLREFVIYFDQQGRIYSVNRYCLDNLKFNSYEIMRLSPEKLFRDHSTIKELTRQARFRHDVPEISTELFPRTGQPIPVVITLVRIDDYLGNFLGMVLLGVDLRQKVKLQQEVAERTRNEKALTQIRQDLEMLVEKRTQELFDANQKLGKEILEKKRAEQQISSDLQEKIQLVKEIHHRVKNNIQIIISLTNMLGFHKDMDTSAREKLKRIAERIRSISAIHEDFYASKNLSRINFSDFIKNSTGEIYANQGAGKNVIFRLNVGNEFLEIDQAIPCGIIYTELLTNALQHAFPLAERSKDKGPQVGTINVEFYKRQDEYTLLISDNGVGLAKDPLSGGDGSSGLGLVNVLVKDHLKGRLIHRVSYGTSFILKFEK
ncbi:MAG: hypothetical protein K0B09_02415 [Bacteroidales bacterium]|nr:hypothetical protein [Bacteroidales bacterium]